MSTVYLKSFEWEKFRRLATELRNVQSKIFIVNPFATTDMSCT